MRPWLALVSATLASAGCLRSIAFHCTTSVECSGGTCETTGFCSFPDTGCTSGQRYGDNSGSVSNQCVSPADAGPDGNGVTFSIGGTVSGLGTQTMVLQDMTNVGITDQKTLNGTGSASFTFAFDMQLPTNATYDATVATPPSGLTVTRTNATGTVATSNITNILITCTPTGTDPGIFCNGSFCAVGSQVCCHDATSSAGTCAAGTTCTTGIAEPCDDTADCGGGTNSCCARITSGGSLKSVTCVSAPGNCTAQMGGTIEILCDPSNNNCATLTPATPNCVMDATRGWSYCHL